jgi:hypothetical protein
VERGTWAPLHESFVSAPFVTLTPALGFRRLLRVTNYKGTIGILTGGGDVPGLNPAIRAVTVRALREGYRVIGLRRGWAGLVDIVRDKEADNSHCYIDLDENRVNRASRTGGTFLHSSRTRPSHLPKSVLPPHLRDKYTDEINDLTPEVLANLEYLGIDVLIAIGGDDTLSYAAAAARRRRADDVPEDDGQRRLRHRLLHRLFDLRDAFGRDDPPPAHGRGSAMSAS